MLQAANFLLPLCAAFGLSLWLTPPAAVAAAPDVHAAPTPHALVKEDLEAFCDGILPLQLERSDVAGATVLVMRGGETLLQKGYGFSDLKTKQAVDPEATMFRLASISKLFTWTAAMQLVEQRKLDLDADVNRYLDFAIRGAGPITLRNLMTHTTGFEETARDIIVTDPKKYLGLREYLVQNQPRPRAAPIQPSSSYSHFSGSPTRSSTRMVYCISTSRRTCGVIPSAGSRSARTCGSRSTTKENCLQSAPFAARTARTGASSVSRAHLPLRNCSGSPGMSGTRIALSALPKATIIYWLLLSSLAALFSRFDEDALPPSSSWDKWFLVGDALFVIAIVMSLFTLLSAARIWRRPATGRVGQIKFTLVTIACVYFSWFAIHWHLITPIHRF